MNNLVRIVCILTFSANMTGAVVIYQDDFTKAGRTQPGGYTQVLKGSIPFNTTTAGQWWKSQWNSSTASLNIDADHLRTGTSSLNARAAFMDFTPEPGFIYTLSVDMSVQDIIAGSGFLAMGFASNTNQIDSYATAQAAWNAGSSVSYTGGEYTESLTTGFGGWKLFANQATSTFRDTGYGGSECGGSPVPGYNTFTVILDTRGVNWTVEWFLNGVFFRSEEYETKPVVRNVFLASENLVCGSYDNFSLVATPESELIEETVSSWVEPYFIYEDDFTKAGRTQPGGYTQVLKGSIPFNTTASGQWWKSQWNSATVSLNVDADRLRTGTSTLDERAAFLDFSPEEGYVYTLSVDMSVQDASAGSGFLAMGFSANTLHIDSYATSQDAWDAGGSVSYTGGEYTGSLTSGLGGWLLYADNTVLTFKDAGYAYTLGGGSPVAGYNTFKVILDTRNVDWIVKWYLNESFVRAATYYTKPVIRNVFLAVENLTGGSYDNFSLKAVRDLRPRLLANGAKDFAVFQDSVTNATESFRKEVYEKRVCARTNLMVNAALVYKIEGDSACFETVKSYLEELCNETPWEEYYMLDSASRTKELGVVYDLLYEDLNIPFPGSSATYREKLKETIINKGLAPYLIQHQRGYEALTNGFSNWNHQMNSGAIVGALAILDANTSVLVSEVLTNAVPSLQCGIEAMDPDGFWGEGFSYFSTVVINPVAEALFSLENTFGTDFRLSDCTGLEAAGFFPIQVTGPTGYPLGYGDTRSERSRWTCGSGLFWLGQHFNQPVFIQNEIEAMETYNLAFRGAGWSTPFVVPEAIPEDSGMYDSLACDMFYGQTNSVDNGVQFALFRSSWTNSDALFCSLKGGDSAENHRHLDLGSFELQALGEQWTVELGYGSWVDWNYIVDVEKGITSADVFRDYGYFQDAGENGTRWNIYNVSSRSHNVPLLNNSNQLMDAETSFERFESETNYALSVLDLSCAYAGQASGTMKRGMLFPEERDSVLIQDEYSLPEAQHVTWGMSTDAHIAVIDGGRSAVLSKNGENMLFSILKSQATPSNAIFMWVTPEVGTDIVTPEFYTLLGRWQCRFTNETVNLAAIEQDLILDRSADFKRLLIELPEAQGNILLPVWIVPRGGQIIYKDDFSRTGRIQPGGYTQVLKASTPMNISIGGQWWKSQWNSGSVSLNLGDGYLSTGTGTFTKRAAFLDFIPSAGFVYTLSVEMSVEMSVENSSGLGFLSMGFSANTNQIDGYMTAEDAWEAGSSVSYVGSEYTDSVNSGIGGWKLYGDNTSGTFMSTNYSGMASGGAPQTGYNRFDVVLDTRGVSWTVNWLLNGDSIRTETYSSDPLIRNVFLGGENLISGTFRNFALTAVSGNLSNMAPSVVSSEFW